MKAAVVTSFDKPLSIMEVPVPNVGSEQILMKVEASGVCHTDLHAARRLAGETATAFHSGP